MSYKVKNIKYQGIPTRILLQNENGPCPLLAAANALLLRGAISLPSAVAPEISIGDLVTILATRVLESKEDIDGADDFTPTAFNPGVVQDETATYDDSAANEGRMQRQRQVEDLISILPSLQYGLDLNPKFTNGPSGCEYTVNVSAFDAWGIDLFHGWLIDPQDKETYDVLKDCTYNQAMDAVVEGADIADEIMKLETTVGKLEGRSAPEDNFAGGADVEGFSSDDTHVAAGVVKNKDSDVGAVERENDEEGKEESEWVDVGNDILQPNIDSGMTLNDDNDDNTQVDASNTVDHDGEGKDVPTENAQVDASNIVDHDEEDKDTPTENAQADDVLQPKGNPAMALNNDNDDNAQVDVSNSVGHGGEGKDALADDVQVGTSSSIQDEDDKDTRADLKEEEIAHGGEEPKHHDAKEERCHQEVEGKEKVAEKTVTTDEEDDVPNLESLSARLSDCRKIAHRQHIIQQFLADTGHQLTYFGLSQLHEYVKDDSLCVFFRNNHFCTMTKNKGVLYLLVTDVGYGDAKEVVWERLDNIDGNTEYVDCDFSTQGIMNGRNIHIEREMAAQIAAATEASLRDQISSSTDPPTYDEAVRNNLIPNSEEEKNEMGFRSKPSEDADRAIALAIQRQYEEERNAAIARRIQNEEYAKRSSTQPRGRSRPAPNSASSSSSCNIS
eukprot:CAMPEP_0116030298 /NCGR_PEP_ID=MMETSP0321-20121206/16770_1 /TAXON_ID=163516 /ORGANISM="Leptocylindrus danicus var. danicus, Strain B650" /LENGTH=670 /DNA_ID=CAMNT_0003505075 /DNA_START=183 /DNA_END=2195 /DNA_ORIENTATION=+